MGSSIQYFLDWFYTHSISFHMLITQHTFLFGGGTDPAHPKHIESINLTCDVSKLVKDAYRTARRLCKRCYLVDPPRTGSGRVQCQNARQLYSGSLCALTRCSRTQNNRRII